MALPFFNGAPKRPEQLLAIDLGRRTTKAVQLHRKGAGFMLSHYAVVEAPAYQRGFTANVLAEHLRSVYQASQASARSLVLAIGVNESIVRHAELPPMPVGDMRQVLKNNSKNYLQQDLLGHVFDCFFLPPKGAAKAGEKPKQTVGSSKFKVLVAGAKGQLIDDLQAVVKSAGLTAECILPGLIGPVNAFELAMPEVFSQEVVALVDIGFKNTSICLLQEGDLVMSRVVGIGGDKLTNGLAEALGISYAEADGIKLGMPTEVQTELESVVLPLGRELRASIDFFEHQQDKAVSRVYIGGGTSRSECIMQMLQTELMAECKPWNPLSFLELSLPPQQAADIEHASPQLAVAVGAALTAF